MGLDVGDRSIGLAVSDPLLLTAQGRPTLRRLTPAGDVERIRDLAQENQVHELVVGLPLHMNGAPSPQSEKVARFAEELRQTLDIPVVLWDERLTTVAAENHLHRLGLNWRRRRHRVDEVAAMFILQSYLDKRRQQ